MSAQEEAIFTSNFAIECMKSGKNPIDAAIEQVNVFDQEINNLDNQRLSLRQRRNWLARWIRASGCAEAKVNRYVPDDVDVPLADENQVDKEFRSKIVRVLETRNSCTVRELQDLIAPNDHSKQAGIIRQIKVLAENRIISKNEGNKIVTGPNWEKRHQVTV